MKKLFCFLLVTLLALYNILLAQSQDQNYIKSTEYLESVLVESDFTSSFGGWLPNGSTGLVIENGRLKASVNSSYEGVKHPLDGFTTTAGETLKIKLVFDKGDTQSDVRLYLHEVDPNGNLVSYNLIDGYLTTGTHYYNHPMPFSGNTLTFRIDKTNTNTSSNTYFFIDYVSLKQGGDTTIKKLENVTYFDGFGKTKQTIGIKQTPNQKDILQHVEYDEFGRTSKQYLALPTTQTSGNYVANAATQITNYYQSNFSDQHPFSETRFDNSPLNRVEETSTPGDAWELLPNSDTDHTTKFDRGINGFEEVFKYDIDENNPGSPLIKSFYPEASLLKSITKNVNWIPSNGLLNTNEIFTDKSGRKIAEFNYENDNGTVKKLTTYYVYDDLGNLRYVLTPKMFDNETSVANYSVNWPVNDFLATGNAGVSNVYFSINNNIISVTSNNKKGLVEDKQLHTQTTKTLNTSATLPNMYLGQVMGIKNFMGNDVTAHIGDAEIVNGNFQITKNFNTTFKRIDIFITVPLTENGFSQTQLDDLAFQYKYDEFNRQIEQKVPGKDWEYVVYDQLDRPILTQDANLRAQDQWLFNKYDAFGRPIYSGLYTNAADRAALQTQVDNFINASSNESNIESRRTTTLLIGGVSINYTNNAFPNNNLETLNVNYYDNYSFTDSSLPTIPTTIFGQNVTDRTKGKLTSTWTKTLNATSWTKSYSFYDNKGRAIYIYEKTHLGGHTIIESKLDFRGKVVESETNHKRLNSSTNLKVVDNFEYDHVERPTKHYQKINTQQEELISSNTYNELGQLQSKKVGGSNSIGTGLQTINHTYNIKGWLIKLNDVNNLGTDLFAYSLKYADAIEGTAYSNPMYNGNIRQAIWKSAKNNIKKGYVYKYDKLNRLDGAYYREGNSLISSAGKFETYNINYDSNGNILGLRRNNQSGSLIDNLTYTYDDGNQLFAIDDDANNTSGFDDGWSTGDDYDYDANGNLIKDLNKDISLIEYNHLDLVKRVTFSNNNKIEFTYDANGRKLQMKNIISGGNTTTIDYIGGFQYTNTILKFFPTAEGYATKDGSTYKYVYVFSDHLGNNRLSYSDINGDNDILSNEIQSNTDYYAMGLIHNGQYNSGYASNFNYKFQGKEQLDFENYNMYDFGSRMYDASVGRWFNVDPQNQFMSPYLAMGNNWVIGVDPDGEFVVSSLLIGALIGAATAAVTYSIPALASGNWNIKDFGTSVAFGAVTGAITAGLSVAGSSLAGSAITNGGTGAFWQSATFNVLSNTASQVGASLAFGDPITAGTIIGSVAGGLVSSRLPEWQAVKGGYFTNAAGELLHNSVRGAISGGVSGNIGAIVDGGDVNQGTLNGARNGAIGSFSQTLGMIAIFGSTRQLNAQESKYIRRLEKKHNFYVNYNVRKGGLYQAIGELEVTWGNNIVAFKNTKAGTYGHEFGHIFQFYNQGWAQFQGKGFKEQILDRYFSIPVYRISRYNENKAEVRNNSVGGRMHQN